MGVVDGQRRKGGEKERKREGVEESWEAGRDSEPAERQREWVERRAGVAEVGGGAESSWVGRWAGGAARGWALEGEAEAEEGGGSCAGKEECSGGNRSGSSLHSSEVTGIWQAASWVPGTAR